MVLTLPSQFLNMTFKNYNRDSIYCKFHFFQGYFINKMSKVYVNTCNHTLKKSFKNFEIIQLCHQKDYFSYKNDSLYQKDAKINLKP